MTWKSEHNESKSRQVTKEDVDRLLVLGELLRCVLSDEELGQLQRGHTKKSIGNTISKNGRDVTK